MSRYASNQEFITYLAGHGLAVEKPRVDKAAHVRRFTVTTTAQEMFLPMDASPAECIRLIRAHIAAHPAG